jgi:hypothetical protein
MIYNFILPENKNLSFWDIYNGYEDKKEKAKLRKTVISECCIEHSTFYQWKSRKVIPALAQKVISEILEIPVNTLFPEPEKTKQVA